MQPKKILSLAITLLMSIALALVFVDRGRAGQNSIQLKAQKVKSSNFDSQINANANRLIEDGRNIFRFDTFGDEAFWGATLRLRPYRFCSCQTSRIWNVLAEMGRPRRSVTQGTAILTVADFGF